MIYTIITALLLHAGLIIQPDSADMAAADTIQSDLKPTVAVIRVEGTISPPVTNYIKRGMERARQMDAQALIIELDTPGGLLKSTKNIVQAMLDSDDLPIVVYVSPEGASAASAGTFITMAAHVATMAPATNIGAASPVQMAPGGGSGQTDTVMQKKIFNYSESYIETIANRRERNAEWAISAVRDGESITAEEAVEINVIDFIAENRDDLLTRLNGRVAAGDTLRTTGATIEEIPTNMAESVLGFLIRPEVMLILTMVAIYGIIGEVTNPGAIIPGMAGVIALILVLYASASVPINIAGFILIGLAIILFISEAFTPTFGLLIAGGAVSFFLGAMMLFQDLPESMNISWAWLIPATILTTLFFIWIATEGIRIHLDDNDHTGKEGMIGKTAEVINRVDQTGGRIFVNGEYWNAKSNQPIEKGKECEIVDIERLKLHVKPCNSDD